MPLTLSSQDSHPESTSLDLPVYLDHAATTPLDPEARAAMEPFFESSYGNATSIHSAGLEARAAVEEAREIVAGALGAGASEICFTSGGTEADNWALKGVSFAAGAGRRILVSAVEHSAVLASAERLESMGFAVERVPVTSEGLVDPEEVRFRLRGRNDVCLVSVMHANNEMGAIQPVAAIGVVCREHSVPFHVDAVQTFGALPVLVDEIGASLLSISAHKLYGPKGVGALYIRRGTRIWSLMDGGEQERGRRGGTLNVPGIVGFGAAARIAEKGRTAEAVRMSLIRDRIIDRVLNEAPGAHLMGPTQDRLPNNVQFCFDGVEGESLLLGLDMAGVQASSGSACTSGSTEPSHVLLAMGTPFERARGALRLSLGRKTTKESADYAVNRLCEVLRELRELCGGFEGN